MSQVTEELVLTALRQIEDPDLHKDIVTLGFIKDLKIDGGDVSFRIVLTTPACPVKAEMESAAKEIVGGLPGVTAVNVTMDAEVPKGRGLGEKLVIEGVRNIVAVSSGKGGVGKSTVAVNLAVSLALDGARVGVMDMDVYGPNVPIMLGAAEARPEVDVNKLIPIEAYGVKLMSMALLQPGEKLAAMYHVPLLGSIPLGMEVRERGDSGVPVVVSHRTSPQARAFRRVAQ